MGFSFREEEQKEGREGGGKLAREKKVEFVFAKGTENSDGKIPSIRVLWSQAITMHGDL